MSRRTEDHASRLEQKQQTRRALVDAALRLLGDKSFDGLSLREVTREVGLVPTAFYRHFANMEELGLVLVDESFSTLRRLLRSSRSTSLSRLEIVQRSVSTYIGYVKAHRTHFQFIARERFGGVEVIRSAIRAEIQELVSELAVDLSHFPFLDRWDEEDRKSVASLIVSAMMTATETLLEAPPDDAARQAAVIREAEKQIRLIVLAIPHITPSDLADGPG